MSHPFKPSLSLFIALLALFVELLPVSGAERPPNFIIIFTDDMGIETVGS